MRNKYTLEKFKFTPDTYEVFVYGNNCIGVLSGNHGSNWAWFCQHCRKISIVRWAVMPDARESFVRHWSQH